MFKNTEIFHSKQCINKVVFHKNFDTECIEILRLELISKLRHHLSELACDDFSIEIDMKIAERQKVKYLELF